MKEPRWFRAAFIFVRSAFESRWGIHHSGILWTEVFNMFVENAVEKVQSANLSASLRVASTLCTEAGAGTFVLRLRAEYFFTKLF
jgi:hypothetical protein